jgi:hypothetical protein
VPCDSLQPSYFSPSVFACLRHAHAFVLEQAQRHLAPPEHRLVSLALMCSLP